LKIFGSQIGTAYAKSAAGILAPSFSLCASSKISAPAAGIAQLIVKQLQICLNPSWMHWETPKLIPVYVNLPE